MFGVTQDAGGVVISGGKPIPVPPWDSLRHMAIEKRDILFALAISELAGKLGDAEANRDLQTRALLAIETAAKGLLAKAKCKDV